MEIEKRVLILAIFKKKDSESINDVLITLEDTRLFSLKQGKKYIKELKKEGILVDNKLSLIGLNLGNKIEGEFKIDS